MQHENWLDLQFFSGEGAAPGNGGAAGVSSADAGQSAGAKADDAGQRPEARPQERRPWDEVKGEYKNEFDAEVQSIVTQRLRREQERTRQLAERETALAPLLELLAERYGLDAEAPDYERLAERLRTDGGPSDTRGDETISSPAEQEPKSAESREPTAQPQTEQARESQLAALRRQAGEHFDELRQQAERFAGKIPDFDLMRELEDDAFAEMTRPGSGVSVEQAYYALHPEFRAREAESVAKRAAEAVSASVRAGAARPAENGTQAASIGKLSYREMSRADREALKKRIYEAGQRGEHLSP